MNQSPPPLAVLLRQYRRAAGLTQEELAERAGLSWRTISDMERGITSKPRKDNVALLADALGLAPDQRIAMDAAARPSSADRVPGSSAAQVPAIAEPVARPAAASNLPLPLTSFIARDAEQTAVMTLLADARLLTLTGTGGAGKTRLALQVASTLRNQYRDGVWLVELAALADPNLVSQAVATALGVAEEPSQPLWTTLSEYLVPRHLLLVLDNCEHLVDACATLVSALLRLCPELRVLVTSREALEVPGEIIYRVPSLRVPDPEGPLQPQSLMDYAAVRLFVERAQARRPNFALTSHNARSVAEICSRLDGIPLAIELAAARASTLPVEAIAERLDDGFRLLTGGPRTVLPRQQTLWAALNWSHELLNEPERLLLRRLSVFVGGCTLEATEEVCGTEGIERWDVLDLLTSLVHKSLLQLEERSGEVRYQLLETVRQYGADRLTAAGETTFMRNRHLNWYLSLVEEAEPALQSADQEKWLIRLEQEHGNLRAALRWSIEGSERAALGVQIAGTLWRFWWVRGYLNEGRNWLKAALESGDSAPADVRARALNGAGYLAYCQGDLVQAESLYEQTLVLRRALADQRGLAATLSNLGLVANVFGNYPRAAALLEESLKLRRELNDERGIAISLSNLSLVARDMDDPARAATLLREALTICRTLEDKHGIAISLTNLGQVSADMGNLDDAAALLKEGLALSWELGDKQILAENLEALATVTFSRGPQVNGHMERAARLLGAAQALRDTVGSPASPAEEAAREQAVAGVHAALGQDAFEQAWAAGRAMPLAEAVAFARADGDA